MIDFDCARFQDWLDDGAGDAAAARAHATVCLRCGPAWATDQEVGRLLAAGPPVPPVPPRFVDAVMARVALAPRGRPLRAAAAIAAAQLPLRLGDALPWWVRATAQPASALALALAGTAALMAPQLAGVARLAPAWSAEALPALAGMFSPWTAPFLAWTTGDPLVGAALALAALPPIAVASYGLYEFGLRVTAPSRAPLAIFNRAVRA